MSTYRIQVFITHPHGTVYEWHTTVPPTFTNKAKAIREARKHVKKLNRLVRVRVRSDRRFFEWEFMPKVKP